MPYEHWIAERQMQDGIEAIEALERGDGTRPIELPESWQDPEHAPPHWDNGPMLRGEWQDSPADNNWSGRRLLYIKLLRMRREWLRLWDSWLR